MSQLRQIAARVGKQVSFYRRVYVHRDTPLLPKILLWLALAYLASPVDLIPDFIPVVGYLDDLVIVPLLIALAMWCVPMEVYDDCRR